MSTSQAYPLGSSTAQHRHPRHERSGVVLVLTAALMLAGAVPLSWPGRAQAASPPVQVIDCTIADDGLGSTNVQVGDQNSLKEGSHPPSPGCNSGGGASPPGQSVSGTCGTGADAGPCSASASASASASTATNVSADGHATLGATATGQAAGTATGTPGSSASAAQSITAVIRFTVNSPESFHVSGSATTRGFQQSSAGARLFGGSAGIILNPTNGGGSASGTLQPGTYTLIALIDARANAIVDLSDPSQEQSQGTANADVSLTLAPPGGCPPDATPSVQVGVALAEGCFTERTDTQSNPTGAFETAQEAWVGGFDLKPQPGAKLVVDPSNHSAPLQAEGGGVDWVLSPSLSIPAPFAEIKPFTPSYTLGLNTAGSLERLVALPLIKDASAQVTVTWGPGGASSSVAAQVSLADISKNLGTALSATAGRSIGTLAAGLTVKLANDAPLSLAAASLQIPEFAVELKGTDPALKLGFGGAKFAYATEPQGKPMWSGEATTFFPWDDRQGSFTGAWTVDDGTLTSLKVALSGFKVKIGRTGWDWTGATGTLGLSPALAFDVGIDLEQQVKVKGDPLFKLSGSVKGLQLAPDCKNGKNPFEFLLSGNSPPLEKAGIGKLAASVRYCAYLSSLATFGFEAAMNATLDVDVETPIVGVTAKKLVTATGSLGGWFSGFDFDVEGNVSMKLPVFGTIAATGVLSSNGYAVCGTYGFVSAGIATNNWVEPPTDLSGCDLTPFQQAPPAAADVARVAAGTRTVAIPSGQSVFALAVRGRTAAPRIRLAGPGRVRFVSPAGPHALKTGSVIIVPEAALRTTYVYLHHPRAGTWRITALADAVTRIDSAHALSKPNVRVRLRHLRGGRIQLTWHAPALRGQQIRLLDRAGGTVTLIQRLTRRHSGRVVFTPAGPAVTRRQIEADVRQSGRPRAQLIIAPYRVALPQPPAAATHLTARRAGGSLLVTWRTAARASGYFVTVATGAQTLAAIDTSRSSLTVTPAPAGQVTVTVTSRDRAGRRGRGATIKIS